MKEKNPSTNPSQNSTNARNFSGVRSAVLIRKNSPEDLLFRRLRQNLLFAKLRSLIPPHALQIATELKVETHEMPQGDSDDEKNIAPSVSSSSTAPAPHPSLLLQSEEEEKEEEDDDGHAKAKKEVDHDEDDDEDDENYKIEVEVEDESKPFLPSIKIIKSEVSLLISTMVLKDVSLTSTLFQLLEQEELEIDYETQYRSETKVSHTFKVNVRPGYDVDELEKKLWRWAGKPI